MARRVIKNNFFGYIDNMFINLYSKENPILFTNDKCYFLFNNISDIHRPLIGYGTIFDDQHTDGMNKIYFIALEEIFEDDSTIKKFLHSNKTVMLHNYANESLTKSQKVHFLTPKTNQEFFNNNLFRIEAFFIRSTLEEIIKLRSEFVVVIKKDLEEQISDINELLQIDGNSTD